MNFISWICAFVAFSGIHGLRMHPYLEFAQRARRLQRESSDLFAITLPKSSLRAGSESYYDYGDWETDQPEDKRGSKAQGLNSRTSPKCSHRSCDSRHATIVIETRANHTLRETLSTCAPLESMEIEDAEEFDLSMSEMDLAASSSIIVFFTVEQFSIWTDDKVALVLKSILNMLEEHFGVVHTYRKFVHDAIDDQRLLAANYAVKYLMSEYCREKAGHCNDVGSLLNKLGSKPKPKGAKPKKKGGNLAEEELQSETVLLGETDEKDSTSANADGHEKQHSSWCRKLKQEKGFRIVDLRATPLQPVYNPTETSLALTDILPLDLKTYDKNRPPKYQGQATVVYFHVTVLSLDTINEESMSWRDHRLRLPENMTEEYRILDVNWLNSIWRPDCFFKNAKKVTFHEMSVPNHYLWLYHDKTLLYMAKYNFKKLFAWIITRFWFRLTLVLSCAMKFENYPHDMQNCSMMIESLSHTTNDLCFRWNVSDPLVVNPEIELPQLDIAHNSTEDCTLEYSTGNFTCLEVVFNLKRRLGYHLFHTYIPSGLIVVMSWISFWIKPEAIPARVTLGVTSLLTLATQSTQSQRSLPPVSYVKAIDIWMSSCTVFVFMSLMEFAVVNNFMGPIATKPMKGYSDEDLSTLEHKGSLNGRRGKSQSPARPVGPQYVTFCHGREVALFIDKWSRIFFPGSFVLLNIVYWTMFLQKGG